MGCKGSEETPQRTRECGRGSLLIPPTLYLPGIPSTRLLPFRTPRIPPPAPNSLQLNKRAVDQVNPHYLPLSPHMKAVIFASLFCPRGEKVEKYGENRGTPCEEEGLVTAYQRRV